MKKIQLLVSVMAVAATLAGSAAMAFDFPKVPSIGGSTDGSKTANGVEVTKNARNALLAFTNAELGLAGALTGYNELAAQQKLLEGMKAGDAAVKKEDLETIVSIGKSANDHIVKKTAENSQLDASNKALAGKSMTQYVVGLVASKKMLSSVQDLAKNPTALGLDFGALLYAGKEMPGIVASGASTTTTLFKYLGANGVDVSEAKSAAKDLGV